MNIQPILTDEDHRAALAEVERLWTAAPDSEDAVKLDILATLIEKYEERRWPIDLPEMDPVEVLQYAINELGHTQTELAEILDSRSRASEILSRQRTLTVEMIRAISNAWQISADLLIKPYRENSKAA
jgi:HTH-type transcriptional regulator/antitoxin HigA